MVTTAFITITANSGKEKIIRETLWLWNSIKEVYLVYGDYDLIAKVETKTIDELNELMMKLRELPHIAVTNTMIGL